MNYKHALAVFVGAMTLGGCLGQNDNLANPVVINSFDASGKTVYTIATTSDRRLAVINATNGRVCMEAPPDATENISASISASVSAALKSSDAASPSAQAALASQVATALSHITQPTQGILLYRFGMSYLCNEYMNEIIDKETYARAAGKMLLIAQALTQQELVLTNGKAGAPSANAPAAAAEGNGSANPLTPETKAKIIQDSQNMIHGLTP